MKTTATTRPAARKRIPLIALLALLTGGCATLSESECRTINWEQLGEEDGARGYTEERLEDHRNACAEHDVIPDEAAWNRGRLAGLDQLCSTKGGLSHGQAGRTYSGVCPQGYEEDFYEGYTLGRKIYQARRELEDVEQEIRQLELDLHRQKTSDDQYGSTYYRLRDYERQRNYLQDEIRRLEDEARRLLAKI